jgi:hypothetical protein
VRFIALSLALALAACESILGIGDTKLDLRHRAAAADASTDAKTEPAQRQRSPDMDASATVAPPELEAGFHDAVVGDAHERSDGGRDAGRMDAIGRDGASKPPSKPPDGSSASSAGDQDGGDPGPSRWQPSALKGLVLWLDAAHGIAPAAGTGVQRWRDLSSNGNDATQSRTEAQPMFLDGAVHGFPAVQFDGNSSYLAVADSSSFDFATEPFTIEVVAAWSNATTPTTNSWGYALLLAKQASDGGFGLFANTDLSDQHDPRSRCGFLLGYYATSWVENLNDGKFRLYGGERVNGTTLDLRVDGSSAGQMWTPAETSATAVGSELLIGGQPHALQFLSGAIAEVVVVRGRLLPVQLEQLEQYFNEKYQLWDAASIAALYASPSFLPVTIADGLLFP